MGPVIALYIIGVVAFFVAFYALTKYQKNRTEILVVLTKEEKQFRHSNQFTGRIFPHLDNKIVGKDEIEKTLLGKTTFMFSSFPKIRKVLIVTETNSAPPEERQIVTELIRKMNRSSRYGLRYVAVYTDNEDRVKEDMRRANVHAGVVSFLDIKSAYETNPIHVTQ
jgi:hypothetical protein